jgi:hypothetical protein
MSRFLTLLSILVLAMHASFAEDSNAELEHKLASRCAELQLQRVELRMRAKNDSPETAAIDEQLRAYEGLLANVHAEATVRAKKKLADIEAELQKMKQGRKDEMDFARMQLLDQSRTAITKKLLELEVGFALPDDPQRNAKQQFGAQNSKLHLKLANGTELDAEGPWLQQSPEARDLLEQLNDPARDGAISFRAQDQTEVDAIREQLVKVAPAVKLEFSEKLHLLTVVSDDAVQLRRAAGVLKALRPNGFDPRFKNGDFNPNMKGQMQDGDNKKAQPGKPGMDEGKKKNTIDDKF